MLENPSTSLNSLVPHKCGYWTCPLNLVIGCVYQVARIWLCHRFVFMILAPVFNVAFYFLDVISYMQKLLRSFCRLEESQAQNYFKMRTMRHIHQPECWQPWVLGEPWPSKRFPTEDRRCPPAIWLPGYLCRTREQSIWLYFFDSRILTKIKIPSWLLRVLGQPF